MQRYVDYQVTNARNPSFNTAIPHEKGVHKTQKGLIFDHCIKKAASKRPYKQAASKDRSKKTAVKSLRQWAIKLKKQQTNLAPSRLIFAGAAPFLIPDNVLKLSRQYQ